MRSLTYIAIWSIALPALESQAEPHIWYCNESTQWCYIIDGDLTVFEEAETYCNSKSQSNLTSITSDEENEDVGNICGCQSCWIGLMERKEADWFWLDGCNSTYRHWKYNEPNNADKVNEKLAVMNIAVGDDYSMSREWFDVPIDHKGAAVCKRRKINIVQSQTVFEELALVEKLCDKPNNRNAKVGAAISFALFICCCCSWCYCCYRYKAGSNARKAHSVVKLNQEEFLRSRHLYLVSVPFCQERPKLSQHALRNQCPPQFTQPPSPLRLPPDQTPNAINLARTDVGVPPAYPQCQAWANVRQPGNHT